MHILSIYLSLILDLNLTYSLPYNKCISKHVLPQKRVLITPVVRKEAARVERSACYMMAKRCRGFVGTVVIVVLLHVSIHEVFQ